MIFLGLTTWTFFIECILRPLEALHPFVSLGAQEMWRLGLLPQSRVEQNEGMIRFGSECHMDLHFIYIYLLGCVENHNRLTNIFTENMDSNFNSDLTMADDTSFSSILGNYN